MSLGTGPATQARSLDVSVIVTKLAGVQQARSLPRGSVVGDLHGGLTFTDEVAAALESRSANGWREVQSPDGQFWTIIALDR